MSITKVGVSDSMTDLKNRILYSTGAGIVAGGIYSSTKNNWLYKGLPSDTFVRETGRAIRKTMSSDELKESAMIARFVKDAINPVTKLEDLKPQIIDSIELSEAIKQTPEESVGDAIARVFSQPADKARTDLVELQYKTKSNNIAGRTAVLRLLNNNFDASKRSLVKNENTSEELFGIVAKTAKKIQVKAVAKAAAITGVAAGALSLILSDIPECK